MNIAGRLEAAWLAQLTREYNDICYQYGVRLQPPVLTLSDSRRRLGQWSPADRGLSRRRLSLRVSTGGCRRTPYW